jgi:hypothetical protein
MPLTSGATSAGDAVLRLLGSAGIGTVIGGPHAGTDDLGWGADSSASTRVAHTPPPGEVLAFPRLTLGLLRRVVEDCVADGFLPPPPSRSRARRAARRAVPIAADPIPDTLAPRTDES